MAADQTGEKNIEGFRIGVISDTHNYLDPKIHQIFQGVDHILHGGDVGLPAIILELEQIAPVTAVMGNTDLEGFYRETEIVTLHGRKFLIHHIVEPRSLCGPVAERLGRTSSDVVVFGHTHKPFCETIESRLFLNPGYAGKQRFNLPRSVAILTGTAAGFSVKFCDL